MSQGFMHLVRNFFQRRSNPPSNKNGNAEINMDLLQHTAVIGDADNLNRIAEMRCIRQQMQAGGGVVFLDSSHNTDSADMLRHFLYSAIHCGRSADVRVVDQYNLNISAPYNPFLYPHANTEAVTKILCDAVGSVSRFAIGYENTVYAMKVYCQLMLQSRDEPVGTDEFLQFLFSLNSANGDLASLPDSVLKTDLADLLKDDPKKDIVLSLAGNIAQDLYQHNNRWFAQNNTQPLILAEAIAAQKLVYIRLVDCHHNRTDPLDEKLPSKDMVFEKLFLANLERAFQLACDIPAYKPSHSVLVRLDPGAQYFQDPVFANISMRGRLANFSLLASYQPKSYWLTTHTALQNSANHVYTRPDSPGEATLTAYSINANLGEGARHVLPEDLMSLGNHAAILVNYASGNPVFHILQATQQGAS